MSDQLTQSSDVAERVNVLHAEMTGHMTMAVKKAIEIGRLLTEQKEQLTHGEWIPWVENNLVFGVRESQNYMRAYRHRDEVNTQRVSHLGSLREAVALLAEPREEQLADDGPDVDLDFTEYQESVPEVVYQRDPDQERELKEAAKHCKSARTIDLNSVANRDGIRGNPNATIIPERDVYRLIMCPKLPRAERFEEPVGKNSATGARWVEKTSRKVQEAKATSKSADYTRDETCEIIALLTPFAAEPISRRVLSLL